MDDDQRNSVVANAIGFEMFRHDGRAITVQDDGVEQIDVTDEETARCRSAAKRVVEHLDHFDTRLRGTPHAR